MQRTIARGTVRASGIGRGIRLRFADGSRHKRAMPQPDFRIIILPQKSGVSRLVTDFARHAGGRGVQAACLVAAGAVLEGAGLALLVPLVTAIVVPADSALAGSGLGFQFGLTLPRLLALFVAVMAVRALMLRWRDLALFDLQARFVESLRTRVIAALAGASWELLVRLDHARVTSMIASDIPRLSTATHYLVQGSVAAAMVTIQLTLAFVLAPRFAAVAVAALVAGGVAWRLARPGTAALGQQLVRANHALLGSAGAFIGGLKAAAAQRASGRFAAEFDDVQRNLTREQRRFTVQQADARTLMAMASALAGVAVIGGGVAAGLAPAVLIALAVIFARMAPLVQQLQQATQQLVYNAPAYDAVRGIEAEFGDLQPSDRSDPEPVNAVGDIDLVDVTYRHPGGGGVETLSIHIGAGECVGVAGPSGGGKTTLIDLVAGLLEPQHGTVHAPRAALGYLPQDAFLFHDSVRRNVSWGDPAFDDAAILEALRIAGADGVVARLAQGLDTIVGERGALLSGGERQRLAIARALLRRPSLLILDEATGAIDPAGEAALLARLKALTPRPTILLVAHRAESLAHCDRVIRVEGGAIVSDQMTSISAL
ncbi:ABC transporter ATP-binding protein [Sphingomonas sp. LT1P40]|uniref:ABC transporter ATP-binding protein n=1 Tax=Alteristakelama amylovorans TaxID=3096166 RepID=UPI002FC732E1